MKKIYSLFSVRSIALALACMCSTTLFAQVTVDIPCTGAANPNSGRVEGSGSTGNTRSFGYLRHGQSGTFRGWARFNINAHIPANATITAAEVIFWVETSSGSASSNYLRFFTGNPGTGTGNMTVDQVWDAIGNSSAHESSSANLDPVGQKTRGINAAGLTFLNANKTVPVNLGFSRGSGGFGFRIHGADGVGDDGTDINKRPVLRVTYTVPTPDYGVEWVASSIPTVWCAGESKTISITVRNRGTQPWTSGWTPPASVNFSWWGDWQSGQDANPRITPFSNLAAGASQTITFTAQAPATAGSYEINASLVRDGVCWFHSNAGGCGPGNTVFTIPITVVDAPTLTGPTTLCAGTTVTLSSGQPVWTAYPSGGTVTTLGNDRIHRFNSSETFTTAQAIPNARVLVIGGGGGGGSNGGGGGGAGGVYHSTSVSIAGNTTVTVGAGGAVHNNSASPNTAATNGGQSAFGLFTAGGGGGGASRDQGLGGQAGGTGTVQGSGGGGGGATATPRNNAGAGTYAGGAGTTPDLTVNATGGGGGGAGGPGGAAASQVGGNGGPGISNDITGSTVWYAGGGGGGTTINGSNGTGGSGGGGNGESTAGTANTGSGGGAERSGGSGIVIVRYTAPKWESSNTAVATVHPLTGVVSGVSAGTATITYTGVNGCQSSIQVTVTAPVGNPSVFGNNEWAVYGYNGHDIELGSGTSYFGRYTQTLSGNDYGFDTQSVPNNGWDNTLSPSASAGWSGCELPENNFTFVHKRQGFPCGTYTLTMDNWDDATRVLINGQQEWNCANWSGAAPACAGAVGTFELDANTTIEVRTAEGTGGANARLQITPVITTLAAHNSTRTCPVSAGSGWTTLVDNAGRVLLSVNPGASNLGNVTARTYVEGGVPVNVPDCDDPTYVSASLDRHWRISSTVAPAANVTLRLYFSGAELTALQNASLNNSNPEDDVTGIGSLRLTKYSGANEDNVFSNNCGTGTISSFAQTGSGNYAAVSGTHYVDFSVPSFSELWLHAHNNSSPLPVELLYFSGKCENGAAVLNWATASEQHNAWFIVERSSDGIRWQVVNTVQGAYSSNSMLTYSVTDPNALSSGAYYRLVQQDYDGTEEVFTPVYLSCESQREDAITLYPNPAADQLHIRASADLNLENAQFSLYDMTGKQLLSRSLSGTERTLDISAQPPGIYFVELRYNNQVFRTRLVKQ